MYIYLYIYILQNISHVFGNKDTARDLCLLKKHSSGEEDLGSVSFQSTESGAGLQLPPMDGMAKAAMKGGCLFTNAGTTRKLRLEVLETSLPACAFLELQLQSFVSSKKKKKRREEKRREEKRREEKRRIIIIIIYIYIYI